MDTKIENLIKNLKPGQKLEIDGLGEVKVIWHDSGGKKKSNKIGNYFTTIKEIVPLHSRLMSPISNPGLKHWNKFGDKLPKRKNTGKELEYLLDIFLSFVDLNGKFTNYIGELGTEYKVYSVGNLKGYYNKWGKLSILENKGKKYIVPSTLPELKTETISENSICCEKCEKMFVDNPININLYINPDFESEFYLCLKCAELAKKNNPKIVKKTVFDATN